MKHAPRLAAAALAACSLTAALVRPSHAALELTPFVGAYHPIESEMNDTSLPLVLSVSPGGAYGARVGWWAGPRFALEGSVAVSGTTMRATGGGSALESSGTILLADGRLRVRLNPGASTAFDLFGGGGILKPKWDLDDFFNAAGLQWETRFGGVVGLGVTANVLSGAGIRFDVEDHIHKSFIEVDTSVSSSPQPDRTQHDLLWSVGLVLPLGSH